MPSEFYNQRKYKHRNNRRKVYKPKYRKNSNIFINIIVVLLIVAATILCLMLVLPVASGGRLVLFGKAEQTPVPTQTPKAAAHPIENVNTDDLARDITVTDTAFQWFADAYSYGNKLMFCGGEIVQNDAAMTALFEVTTGDNDSLTAKRINIVLENDHIMYPVFNDSWIVYLDAKANGGGKIKYCKQGEDISSAKVVKEVYTGHPSLYLSGNNLAWTERTGTSMDKLYLCDLTTMESATVQMFNKTTYYGVSKPNLKYDKLIWADVDTEKSTGGVTSQIGILNTKTGEFSSYKPGMYVHDPKSNGKDYIAWMTGNHGLDTDLYIAKDLGEPECVAEGIVDFFMDDTYLAYQKDEKIYVYIFTTKKTYKISKSGQNAQLLGASANCVVWSDVTSRTREIPEYAVIPN